MLGDTREGLAARTRLQVSAGYRLVDGALKNQEWVAPAINTTADGALYLTALDHAKWNAALDGGACRCAYRYAAASIAASSRNPTSTLSRVMYCRV